MSKGEKRVGKKRKERRDDRIRLEKRCVKERREE
jgi:hypothetical protein